MARHRRDDQQLRAAFDALAAEMLELAERLAQHDLLGDRHRLAVDDGGVEAEFRLAARRRGMGEDVEGRCDDRPHVRVSEGIAGFCIQPAPILASVLAPASSERCISYAS